MKSIKEHYEQFLYDRGGGTSIPHYWDAIDDAAASWTGTPDQIDDLMEIFEGGEDREFFHGMFKRVKRLPADFLMPFLRMASKFSLPRGRDDTPTFATRIAKTWGGEVFWTALARLIPELDPRGLRSALYYPAMILDPDLAATPENILQLSKAAEKRFLSDDCPSVQRVILEQVGFGPNGWLGVREKAKDHPDERIRRLHRTVCEMPQELRPYWRAHSDRLWPGEMAQQVDSIPFTGEIWDWLPQALDHPRLSSFVASLFERKELKVIPEKLVRAIVRRARLAADYGVSFTHGQGGWSAARWAKFLYDHVDEALVTPHFLSGSLCWPALYGFESHSFSLSDRVTPDHMKRYAEALSASGLVVFDVSAQPKCVALWGRVWDEQPKKIEYCEQSPYFERYGLRGQTYKMEFRSIAYHPYATAISEGNSQFSCHWEACSDLICYFIRWVRAEVCYSDPFTDLEVKRATELVAWQVVQEDEVD